MYKELVIMKRIIFIIGVMLLIGAITVTALTKEEAGSYTNNNIKNNLNVEYSRAIFTPQGASFYFELNSLQKYNIDYFKIRRIEIMTHIDREHIDYCKANYNNCYKKLVLRNTPMTYINDNNASVTVQPIMYQIQEMARWMYQNSKNVRDEARLSNTELSGNMALNITIED